jgi:hypothetical protein
LVVSILAGIILPISLLTTPIDWDLFFYLIVLGFTLVWAIYSLILLGYVFLVEGRQKRNKSEKRKEEDPFPPNLIQEWEALWEITIKRRKDNRGMGNSDWN